MAPAGSRSENQYPMGPDGSHTRRLSGSSSSISNGSSYQKADYLGDPRRRSRHAALAQRTNEFSNAETLGASSYDHDSSAIPALSSGRENLETTTSTRSHEIPYSAQELPRTHALTDHIPQAHLQRDDVKHEKQKETYDIRHIRWQPSQAAPLRYVPVLIQSKNGPCPLLALVNALVLRSDPAVESPVRKALETRENISLGLLIQALLEELITRGGDDGLPDIEEMSSFLTMLHTGMNVNPCLIPNRGPDQPPEFFQPTRELTLYGTFGVPLLHGWSASEDREAQAAMERTNAKYYEDTDLLHLEYTERPLDGQPLTTSEAGRMADVERILRFTKIDHPTQLTRAGLVDMMSYMVAGEVAILFRNNHFATLYKHPDSHDLYTLVTDLGYANRVEVVWESLLDASGKSSRYYSGDFQLVGGEGSNGGGGGGGGGARSTAHPAPLPVSASQAVSSPSYLDYADPVAARAAAEREDADLAYAMQLQEEERGRSTAQTQRRRDAAAAPATSSSSRSRAKKKKQRETDTPGKKKAKSGRNCAVM
ncbi:hypothetical protein KEM52_004943 [Ascosphaera acerosa]|nr:hypothetical protein KEM52_004943 [Ascosphaera acerosa]